MLHVLLPFIVALPCNPVGKQLYDVSPYTNFSTGKYNVGSNTRVNSILPVVLLTLDTPPKLMVQVGSWKGESTILFAETLRSMSPCVELVCVDTWLGNVDDWMWFSSGLARKNGYPSVYLEFIDRIMKSGHQDIVTPFPVSSVVGSIVLRKIQADVVYIDGRHNVECIHDNLVNWWPVVRAGGRMFGNRYNDHMVAHTIRLWCSNQNDCVYNETFTTHKTWVVDKKK